MSSYKNPPK